MKNNRNRIADKEASVFFGGFLYKDRKNGSAYFKSRQPHIEVWRKFVYNGTNGIDRARDFIEKVKKYGNRDADSV